MRCENKMRRVQCLQKDQEAKLLNKMLTDQNEVERKIISVRRPVNNGKLKTPGWS